MKIEVGESLVLSWMRHVLGCQIVQLNWKPSVTCWRLHDEPFLVSLVTEMQTHFRDQHSRDIFNHGEPEQLIRQGEIDVLGLRRGDGGDLRLFAADVANHLGGLKYGGRDETVARVLKKLVRSAVSVHGYFTGVAAEVLFAAPKVDPRTQDAIEACIEDVNEALGRRGLSIEAKLICNDEFRADILEAVVGCASAVADTSEIFLRSVQLYQVAERAPRGREPLAASRGRPRENGDEVEGLDRPKIGKHVQEQVRRLVDEGLIGSDEIVNLQKRSYSKETFGQSLPFLKRHDPEAAPGTKQHRDANNHSRYYAVPYEIGGQRYYLCSQWDPEHRSRFDAWVENRRASRTGGPSMAFGTSVGGHTA